MNEQPFIASQRESKNPGVTFMTPTQSGWPSKVPVNVYSTDLKGYIPGEDTMGQQNQASIVDNYYFKHAQLPLPDGKMSTRRPVEDVPGIVGCKYEFVFVQRNTHLAPRTRRATLTMAGLPMRGARPNNRFMFTPAVTLRQLNIHLEIGNEMGGWDEKSAFALFNNLQFLGGIDSVGPGETMHPDLNIKAYTVVLRQRFMAANIWRHLDRSMQYLSFALMAQPVMGDKVRLMIVPVACDDAPAFKAWTEYQEKDKKWKFVHEYHVGYSGPHQLGAQGGKGIAQVKDDVALGSPNPAHAQLPRHEIFITGRASSNAAT